jgi:DNA repair protein RecO (recombination protein O)
MSRSLSETGLIIRVAPLGDSDRFVTFFTKEHGKITTIAKGIRSIKSRRNPHIELMNRVRFQYWKSKHYLYLTQAQAEEHFRDLKKEINVMASGIFITEALERLTPEEEPNPALFELLNTALELMNFYPQKHVEIREATLIKLLQQLGHITSFRTCSHCQKRLPQSNAYLDREHSTLSCQNCVKDHPTFHYDPVSLETLKLMHFLLEHPLGAILQLKTSSAHISIMTQFGRTFLQKTLHHPLKSERSLHLYK